MLSLTDHGGGEGRAVALDDQATLAVCGPLLGRGRLFGGWLGCRSSRMVEGFLALFTTCAHEDGPAAGGGRSAAGAGRAGPGVDPGACGGGRGGVVAAAVKEPTVPSAVVR